MISFRRKKTKALKDLETLSERERTEGPVRLQAVGGRLIKVLKREQQGR